MDNFSNETSKGCLILLVFIFIDICAIIIGTYYHSKNNNNNIILEVQYDDHIILGTTSLTFIKQGEIGTNGTDIVCKLIPNTVDESAMPQYPICTYNGTTTTLNYTTPSSTDK